MNNAGSFPVSPTPQKRVLTEAFPFLAHGGGTCGYLVMANLELLVWCFFVSFIANDYIFFPGQVMGFCSYLFDIFTSHFFWEYMNLFSRAYFSIGLVQTTNEMVDLDPQGVFFSLQTTCIVGLQPQASDFAKRNMEKNIRKNP